MKERKYFIRPLFFSTVFFNRNQRWMRYCFYSVLVICLIPFFAFIYFSQFGLPQFITTQISRELSERGFDFSAQKLKPSWNFGVEAKGLTLARSKEGSAQFYLGDVVLVLDFRALCSERNLIKSVLISNGNMNWPLGNSRDENLELRDIEGTMFFSEMENDTWILSNFKAIFLNVRIQIQGTLNNASALSEIKTQKSNSDATTKVKKNLLDILNKLKTHIGKQPPKLLLNLRLDAADWLKFGGEFVFEIPYANGEYLEGRDLCLRVAVEDFNESEKLKVLTFNESLSSLTGKGFDVFLDNFDTSGEIVFCYTNMLPRSFHATLAADNVSNKSFDLNKLWMSLNATEIASDENKLRATLETTLSGFTFQDQVMLGSSSVSIDLDTFWNWNENLSDLFDSSVFKDFDCAKYQELVQKEVVPIQFSTKFSLSDIHCKLGSVPSLNFNLLCSKRLREAYQVLDSEKNAFWRWFVPWRMEFIVEVKDLDLFKPVFNTEEAELQVVWDAPKFEIMSFCSKLYNGALELNGGLDIVTRRAMASARMTCDAHKAENLLDAAGRKWLGQFGWRSEEPPLVTADAQVLLADWTNLKPDWKNDVLPTLELKGHIAGTNANFKGVPVLTADGDFCLTNSIWTLPNFKITRPEGEAQFSYEGNSINQDYFWDFTSSCNPKDLGPILGAGAVKVLDMFEFTEPPTISAKLWGRWKDLSKSGLDSNVKVCNFVFRKQPFRDVSSHITYTNGFVRADNNKLCLNDEEHAVVEEVTYSSNNQTVTITNGVCHVLPEKITKMIGPVTHQAMSHYHFSKPPDVEVNGVIPVEDSSHSFMDFQLLCSKEFNWWKLTSQNLQGLVKWQGDQLILTNLVGWLYNGWLDGWASFDFKPEMGSDFKFNAEFNECQLQPFVESFSTKSNKLSGILDGRLVITNANTSDWKSWNGYGNASITNGVIWDIPVFGIFSTFLNEISPGLGNSQGNKGNADFVITNSIIWSDNLEISSPTFQIQYEGTLDFQRNLEARVDVDLIKGWGLGGKLINFMSTPVRRAFRCQVSGTMERPKIEFMYIPRGFMALFRPVATLKKIFHIKEVKEVDNEENDAGGNEVSSKNSDETIFSVDPSP